MGMTDRDRKVLMAVLVLLLIGGLWFMLIKPKQAAVSEANAAKQEAQAALDSANAAEAAAKAVKLEKPEHYAKLVRLGAAIPADDDFASLLVQIDGLGLDHDVKLRDLAVAPGAAGGATAAVGGTSCEDPGASGQTGEAASAPASTPATGSTSETWVGKSKDKAEDAAATAAARNAQTAALCAKSATLADLSAKAAGLESTTYTLSFRGSFFDLDTFFGKLLGLVRTHNGKVTVNGRLLDITQINLSVQEFPMLSAAVQVTGYMIPAGGLPTQTPEAPAPPPAGTPAADTGGAAGGQ